MKLVDPKAEYWSEEGLTAEEHIARCAALCYDSHPKNPQKLVASLIKNGHVSMLRHASVYKEYIGPTEQLPSYAEVWKLCPFIEYSASDYGVFLSTNMQFYKEHEDAFPKEHFIDIPMESLLDLAHHFLEVMDIFRMTFCLTTQIGTSRELNRMSPNNIAERSTRYCSSKDGLLVCKPWWWNEEHNESATYAPVWPEQESYLTWIDDEEHYKNLIDMGMKPEDARGVLPLETMTKVAYTYTLREWKHMLDLRLYGKTGKPHPDCKVITSMVRDNIAEFLKLNDISIEI